MLLGANWRRLDAGKLAAAVGGGLFLGPTRADAIDRDQAAGDGMIAGMLEAALGQHGVKASGVEKIDLPTLGDAIEIISRRLDRLL
jgi:hypothetical protein